ncbi:hypothetical protein BD626DRAFT_630145 [Schizophyllum amplum]|uniref:F-box domain-containing protein n=1 Tax=Schizophyllum amplum TaxID=97359 RepID=A0A550CFR5_9AGAR|nr:hypothetical protein BD626DRAFT_630145 [Auriculariopsis ampla]
MSRRSYPWTGLEQQAAALVNHDLLRSGWAPSHEDVTRLRKTAEDLRLSLPSLDEEFSKELAKIRRMKKAIRRAKGRLNALSQQKTRMTDQARLCTAAAAAPIRRLPVEILADIFDMVLDSIGCFTRSGLHSLSAVCYVWRLIVQSTPQLWARISLDWWSHENLGIAYERPNDPFIRAQLRWSAAVPLKIRIRVGGGCDSEARLSDSWRNVCEHSRRWKDVAISLYSSNSTFGDQIPLLALPLLEDLAVYDHGSNMPPFKAFADAPNLSYFYIRTASSAPWEAPWSTWKTLSQLHLQRATSLNCFRTLQELGLTLTTLTINVTEVFFVAQHQAEPPRTPIELPLLERLRIIGDHALRQVCPLLLVPSMQRLTLDVLWEGLDGHVDVLRMVHQSSATITTLVIANCSAPSNSFTSLLEGLPTVTELVLMASHNKHSSLTENFFARLTPSVENPNCPLPNLQCLSVSISVLKDAEDLPYNSLLQMLRGLRQEETVVHGRKYPALKQRSITRDIGDDLFADPDSDAEDDEYVPGEVDDDDDTEYSLDASADGLQNEDDN